MLGADKGYDAKAFVEDLKRLKITPHVAINGTVSKTGKARKTAVPDEVSATDGYAISLRCRNRPHSSLGNITPNEFAMKIALAKRAA